MKGDYALECSIARNTQFGEWSVWLQRHKVSNARSCTSCLPSRLKEGEVCTQVLFADDERCRVCVNPTISSPPDSPVGKVARTIEADKRGSCLFGIIILLIEANYLTIVHISTPPGSNAVSFRRLVNNTINSTLHPLGLRVTQGDERGKNQSAIDFRLHTIGKHFFQILIGSHITDDNTEVAIYLASDVCVRQTQLVVEGRIRTLKVGKLCSHSRDYGSLAFSIIRIISRRNI